MELPGDHAPLLAAPTHAAWLPEYPVFGRPNQACHHIPLRVTGLLLRRKGI
jgi:hypothetical protein